LYMKTDSGIVHEDR